MSSPAKIAKRAVDRLDLTQPPDRSRRESSFKALLFAATVISVVVLAVLIVSILVKGGGSLSSTLFTEYGDPRRVEEAGFRSGLFGTVSLMLLVALLSFPLGVGAALYLEEFAPDNRFTRLVEANVANLAGVPSVVYGLLGFGILIGIFGWGRNLIVGAITLSLLILPVIIVAGRESLRAVPQEQRAAGLALGATPLQVAFTTTLPAAMPGILTGTILALSRAIGETAPILVAGAAVSLRQDPLPWQLTEGYTAMPLQIFQYVQNPNPAFRDNLAAAGIILLMIMLLLMNSFAIYLRNRYTKKG